MRHGFIKNLLTFLAVFALTVLTVATLSTATAARSDTAPQRYAQQLQAAQEDAPTELSAALPVDGLSPLVSVGAFSLILAVPAAGLFFYRRSHRKGQAATAANRSYRPRADMISAHGGR